MTGKVRGVAVDLAHHRIREAIVRGELQPGQRLNQEVLARRFGMSRSPVREALRELAGDGLVSLKPNATAEVTILTAAQFDEIYRMRERLDPVALAASIPRLTDGDLAQLATYVRQMDQVGDSDLAEFEQLDRAFHFHGRASAPLPQFRKILDSLWDVTANYRRSFWVSRASIEMTQIEHRLILDACERRDPEDADRFLTTHIRRTRTAIGRRPEAFDPKAGQQLHTA